MSSVLEFLRNYHGGQKKDAVFNLGEMHERTRFITFDMIDANTLTSAEDVMEIILSRMLSYLDDLPSDLDFQELYRQIDSLHKNLGRVYGGKAQTRDGYGIAALQQIADNQKVIDDFRRLVRDFNREVGKGLFNENPCYLVVALDDIDLYQGADGGMRDRQFALLEHIYNHLRTPGLVVLMSFNEYILRRKCNEHFAKIYFGELRPKEREYTRAEREDIEKLTAQFMSKLFPQERRIYMPNYLVVNVLDQPDLYVNPVVKVDGKDIAIIPFAKGDVLPVKQFMLRLIAHLTGVYFDAAGTKQHFFEPRNLRELGELFQVISHMQTFEEDDDRREEYRVKNRQILLNYLYEQYSLKHLRPEEYRQFQQLCILPLERQNTNLVDRIREQRRHHAAHPDAFGYLPRTSQRDRWKYSYGELLHNIYFATRVFRNVDTGEMLYSKEYIHCILGTHSVILKQFVHDHYQHRRMLRPLDKPKLSNMLRLLGSSIAGRWANEMLPSFGSTELSSRAGSISGPVWTFIDWKVPQFIRVDEKREIPLTGKLINLYHSREKKERLDLIQYVKELALVFMLFSSLPEDGLGLFFETDVSADRKEPILILKSDSQDHICFNALNFVINLYDALESEDREGYLGYIRKSLVNLGIRYANMVVEKREEWPKERAQAKRQEEVEDRKLRNPLFGYTEEQIKERHEKADYRKRYEFADLWERETRGFGRQWFMDAWVSVVHEAISELQIEIIKWKEKYAGRELVLPVEHFDMMYNVIKRLANDSYYDRPAEVAYDKIYDYYVRLYKNVVNELEKQDKEYCIVKEQESFASAFRECVFYKYFCNPPGSYSSISRILSDILSRAWRREGAVSSSAQIKTVDDIYGSNG